MSRRYRSWIGANSKGFTGLRFLLMIPLAILAMLILAVGFYEGRKAYWDYRVKEMCEKDGGVTVHEKVSISAEQYNKLPKVADSISIPPEALAKPESPLFSVDDEIVQKEWAPAVSRRERHIKRRLDSKVIGKIVSYSRAGGDFPTGIGHQTSFSCPEYRQIYADQSQFFMISGLSK